MEFHMTFIILPKKIIFPFLDTTVRLLKRSFIDYKIVPSFKKNTKLKFSKVNTENSRTTIIYNTEDIFLDYH